MKFESNEYLSCFYTLTSNIWACITYDSDDYQIVYYKIKRSLKIVNDSLISNFSAKEQWEILKEETRKVGEL